MLISSKNSAHFSIRFNSARQPELYGIEHIIPSDEIADECNTNDENDSTNNSVREAVRELREKSLPIASCRDGFFIPKSRWEANRFIQFIKSKERGMAALLALAESNMKVHLTRLEGDDRFLGAQTQLSDF